MQARAYSVLLAIAVAFLSWLVGTVFLFDIPGRVADWLRFLIPGVVLVAIAWRLRAWPATQGRIARIGMDLLLVSAAAFAAQGLLAFDPADPDAFTSRMRAGAWAISWIAFIPGAPFYAGALGRKFALWSIVAATVMCTPALQESLPTITAYARFLFMPTWFAWWFSAALRPLSRGAA
jgi:hypothetical protein